MVGHPARFHASDRQAFPSLLRAFGAQRRPETLNVRDWTSFIERRRIGELSYSGRKGKAVRAEIVRHDCELLLAVLNWAERARDDSCDGTTSTSRSGPFASERRSTRSHAGTGTRCIRNSCRRYRESTR